MSYVGVVVPTYDILGIQQLQKDIGLRRAYRTALAQVDNSRCQISGGGRDLEFPEGILSGYMPRISSAIH